jgi:2-polyprenyl-3-methyl-5-hydroxy-6-metoxy-1,4-benzoquinol methylase
MSLFDELEKTVMKPKSFEHYTSPQLWNDLHISKGMPDAYLDSKHDAASYRTEFINKAVGWIKERFNIAAEMKILDFGCGPGLWTTRFAELGAA